MIPDWADPLLSNDLPILRSRGENHELEYMREFPQQARELGKEIAGFASSNPGRILIGVSDEGDLVGVEGCESSGGRDALVKRIEGVCTNTVAPSVTPTVQFGVEDGRIVLALSIARGPQPVYYCNNVPYVRHIRQARPAQPHEVVELVREFLGKQPDAQADAYGRALANLSYPVAEILIASEELDERRATSSLEQVRSSLHSAAAAARELAADDALVRTGDAAIVTELADSAEAAALFRLTLGAHSWRMFVEKVAIAAAIAREMRDGLISQVSQDADGVQRNISRIRSFGRQVAADAARLPAMYQQGRVQEQIRRISLVGANVLHRSVFPLHQLPKELHERLVKAGRTLHLSDTLRPSRSEPMTIEDLQESIEKAAGELISVADESEAWVNSLR